ncbi:branched-chain amino acid ABC transporter permease [Labrenzia sp. 011]|uniref:branched-chain amino acid ABC transporter permease n=1 Tax=Labrenzia sp. 011 TaxID=2171494 RepID=UPI000D51D846|nr:branched-chain amino acid ABC transporter permease [Labrenzia sp. 011]PVB59894.1 branched-chain amino acid ABC transporter permease [Labrenzia sp. 011]
MPRKLLPLLLIVALACLPFVADWLDQRALQSLVARIMIYAIAAASLNLILGFGGMVSFGHAAFFGLGNYAVGILYFHFADSTSLFGFIPGTDNFLITFPAAILVAGLFALLIGLLALRTEGVQFIMITLAFAQMIFAFFVSLNGYGGDDGLIIRKANTLFGMSLRNKTTIYYVILAVAVGYFFWLHRVKGSSFGNILAGIRQNEKRMVALGINPFRYKLFAFVLAGMGAGAAGALMAVFLRFASPDTLAWTKSGEFMIMVILGGVGSFVGPIWGAATFLVLHDYLASWTEHWQLFMGLLLLFVVLRTKGGIAGAIESFRARFK